MKLAAILDDYLDGRIRFGRQSSPHSPTPEELRARRDWLVQQLAVHGKFNNRVITAMIACYVLAVAVGGVIVLLNHDKPGTLVGTTVGLVVSLSAVTIRVRSLWREKWYVDVLLTFLPTLPPEEAMTAIRTFFEQRVRKESDNEGKIVFSFAE